MRPCEIGQTSSRRGPRATRRYHYPNAWLADAAAPSDDRFAGSQPPSHLGHMWYYEGLFVTPGICACKPEFLADGQCLSCDDTRVRNLNREKTLKSNHARRIPGWDDYLAFEGAHCRHLYANLSDQWKCPCCDRTKFELLRWTMLFPNQPDKREGWAAGLHTHHDHGADPYGIKPQPGELCRITSFAPITICEQCNSADGSAKRHLKLPRHFTFEPAEIRAFVRPTPHGKHLIKYDVAKAIFDQVTAMLPFFPWR